jgi:hypothetical protein
METDLKDLLKASYLPQKRAEDLMGQKGYTYDKDLSNMEQKVFISPTGQPVIAERGSKRVSDWLIEDPQLLLGGVFGDSRRVSQAKQLSKETEAKYGMAPTLVGHSLGGYLAEQGARKGSDVYTYNKASGLPSAFYSTPKSQHDYRTTLDLPSALSSYQRGGEHTTLKGSWNPFESHNIKYLKV